MEGMIILFKAVFVAPFEPGRQKTSFLLITLAVFTLPFMGRSFLPEFNEGTFNISMATVPGTSLEESDKIGHMVESILLSHH